MFVFVFLSVRFSRSSISDSFQQKTRLVIPGTNTAVAGAETSAASSEQVPDDIRRLYEKIDRDDEEIEEMKIVSFEVMQSKIEKLRKKSDRLLFPRAKHTDASVDVKNWNIHFLKSTIFVMTRT